MIHAAKISRTNDWSGFAGALPSSSLRQVPPLSLLLCLLVSVSPHSGPAPRPHAHAHAATAHPGAAMLSASTPSHASVAYPLHAPDTDAHAEDDNTHATTASGSPDAAAAALLQQHSASSGRELRGESSATHRLLMHSASVKAIVDTHTQEGTMHRRQPSPGAIGTQQQQPQPVVRAQSTRTLQQQNASGDTLITAISASQLRDSPEHSLSHGHRGEAADIELTSGGGGGVADSKKPPASSRPLMSADEAAAREGDLFADAIALAEGDEDDSLGDELTSRLSKELGESSRTGSGGADSTPAEEQIRFATFDSRLKFFKVMLKAAALHPKTPFWYRLYVRTSTWGCTCMCLLNLFFHTQSYRNVLFDVVLVMMHLWVSGSSHAEARERILQGEGPARRR